MINCRYVLFYFIFLFLTASSNQHLLGIFIIVSLVLFIITISLRRLFIKFPQEKIIVLRGVLDEVDDILMELPGDEGFRVLVLLPHKRLAYGHPYPIPSFFSLKIARVNGIDDTIIITLELESPILLQ